MASLLAAGGSRYFYPRSGTYHPHFHVVISIHALLAESDRPPALINLIIRISIHALLAESDLIWRYLTPKALKFLSTLSLRRATVLAWFSSGGVCDFYPRSPCGERQPSIQVQHPLKSISIHALLAESDAIRKCQIIPIIQISIHALLAESDSLRVLLICPPLDFYPRSPCGERLWPGLLARPFFLISIHALLAESDLTPARISSRLLAISIHALLAESDVVDAIKFACPVLFLSTLSLRRATIYNRDTAH